MLLNVAILPLLRSTLVPLIAQADISAKENSNGCTGIVRTTRSKTRQGERSCRLPAARSATGKSGGDYDAVVRAAPRPNHVRGLRCVCGRGRKAESPQWPDRQGTLRERTGPVGCAAFYRKNGGPGRDRKSVV